MKGEMIINVENSSEKNKINKQPSLQRRMDIEFKQNLMNKLIGVIDRLKKIA